jgi:predicted acetyltransferase
MPTTETMALVRAFGWEYEGSGWLDEPFFRNVRTYVKQGFKYRLIVSVRRNKVYYLDETRGIYGHFKPLNRTSLIRFEEIFK